jgi:CRP/FNR family transcriptional regulator, anaerobic regulatory protein
MDGADGAWGDLPIWQLSSDEVRGKLAALVRIRSYMANAAIAPEPEAFRQVGFVVSGVVRLVKHRPDGADQVIGLLFRGDMFGRIFSHMPPLTIEAATETTLALFDHAAFEALLAQHRELERIILMTVCDELDASYELLTILGSRARAARIASFLLYLCRRTAPGERDADGARVLSVPVNRHDMAACLATTVETISRSVHALDAAGAIRIIDPRTFALSDVPRLRHLAGEEPHEDMHAEPARRRDPTLRIELRRAEG